MKKVYITPQMKVREIDTEDILQASLNNEEGDKQQHAKPHFIDETASSASYANQEGTWNAWESEEN